jgi:hypothetical protein
MVQNVIIIIRVFISWLRNMHVYDLPAQKISDTNISGFQPVCR